MVKQKEIERKLKKYKQDHIIKYINKMDEKSKQEILEQISQIDIEQINKIYEDTKINRIEDEIEITPIDYIDKNRIRAKKMQELQEIGEKIITNDEYGIVTMAGGQGTRLGFKGPKGAYRLDIGEGKYIFQILAENIKKSKEQYNILPYWYIMTSEQNNEETIKFFEENKYFGYDKQRVKFFKQGAIPIVTAEGKLIIENNKIKVASDGNGGVYKALEKSKMLEDMKKNKIKWVYISRSR